MTRGKFIDLKAWWEERSPRYPYVCRVSADVKPHHVDRSFEPFISAVFQPGVRSYAFQTQATKDAFLSVYKEHES